MNYTKTHLEDFVEALYNRIDITKPEQLDPEIISARLGITLDYVRGPSKSVYAAGIVVIVLNNELPPALQWQDFAHELAHVLRHTGNQHLLPPSFKQFQEWQADHFASHFCVPTFMLEQLNLPWDRKEAIAMIAEQFGVMPWFAAASVNQWFNRFFF